MWKGMRKAYGVCILHLQCNSYETESEEIEMNRHIYRLVAAVLAAITIVSCNNARKRETYRLLEDVGELCY